MKFLALIVTAATAATAAAAPNPHSPTLACTPGTYSCADNEDTGCPGWATCDVSGTWVFSGDCPPMTECYFNTENKNPYCI